MSQPYYQDDAVTIYHGDCREVLSAVHPWTGFSKVGGALAGLPIVNAAVMVTDPPYGMAYHSGWSGGGLAVTGDEDPGVRDAVLRAWHPRPAAVFGRWNVARPEGTRARLIWDKGDWPGMGDLSFPWGPSDEEVYILGDGWVGTREGTILRRRRIGGGGLHPTEKPVDLLENIVRKAPPGTVLDPFMGSGTTLVAAKNLGRKAIGIEIEERYCEIAAKRCAQGVLAL